MNIFHKKVINFKKKNQFAHSCRRARERYHIDLTKNLHDKIVKDIQCNQAIFIQRESRRVSVWAIEVCDKKCIVLYDSHRKSLITFLPREKKYNHIIGTELICKVDCKYCNYFINKEEYYAK